MANQTLFPVDSAVALRQPKTDRLILPRFLKDAAEDKRLDENELKSRPRRAGEMGRSGDFRPPGETQRNPDAGRFPGPGVWRGARVRRTARRKGSLAPRAALSDCRRNAGRDPGLLSTDGGPQAAGGDRTQGAESPPRPRPQQRPHRRGPMLGLSGQYAARVPLGHRLQHRQFPALRAGLDETGLRAFHAAIAARLRRCSSSSTCCFIARG